MLPAVQTMAQILPVIRVTSNTHDGSANPESSNPSSISAVKNDLGEIESRDIKDGMHNLLGFRRLAQLAAEWRHHGLGLC